MGDAGIDFIIKMPGAEANHPGVHYFVPDTIGCLGELIAIAARDSRDQHGLKTLARFNFEELATIARQAIAQALHREVVVLTEVPAHLAKSNLQDIMSDGLRCGLSRLKDELDKRKGEPSNA